MANEWTKEQLDAINKTGTNIIVSAGAGSGKTTVLTERVITKLKTGIHINELLILTFTNNAANEMKIRIKNAIKNEPQLKDELKLIDSADITTFDAYVLSLVKKYHYYLNIDSDINIINSSIIKQKKKEIINRLFDSCYEDINPNFINFVTNFGVKNDKLLRNYILDLDNQFDLIINKEEYLNDYINNYYSSSNINFLFDDFEKLLLKRVESIKDALNNLYHEVPTDYYEKVLKALTPLLESTKYDEIRNNLVKIGPLRLPKNSSNEASHYKEQIVSIEKKLEDLCIYNKNILIKDLLETEDYAKVIIELLIKLNNEIKEYKLVHNMYEFNDISKMAIKLLKDNINVASELKNYYKEIMIDEYQDTSDIEEEFISLIQNNNVYMVGDIKQSIYRFRNANPDIFRNKYNNYKNNNGGIKIDLNKNFRSRNEVLNSINEIFNHIMDDTIGNANYKKEHQLIFGLLKFNLKGQNNYDNNLEILNYNNDTEYTKEEIEAFIIGNDISKKIKDQYLVLDKDLRPCSYSDFCILMDRTGAFDTYKKVFDYLKIPLLVYKDEDILLSDENYLIKNILSLIIDIKNHQYNENTKLYYTSIARSYLFNEEDNIIYQNIINNNLSTTNIYQKCSLIAKILDTTSNKGIIERIINDFDFYQKMITKGDIKHRTIILNNLINNAAELNKIGTDIYGMNDYLNSLIEDNEKIALSAIINNSNSVTITNIHKSKGLEYKICYYSGFHKEFNMQEIKKRIIFSNKYGLILPSYEEGFKPTFASFLNKENYISEEISEKLRLFYVALTRCKEKMIIVTSLNKDLLVNENKDGVIDYLDRINIKSFTDILNASYKYIDKYVKDIKLPNIDKKYQLIDNFNIKDYVNNNEKIIVNEIEKSEVLLTEEHYSKASKRLYTKEEKNNMLYGTKIHYVLENMNLKDPDYSLLNDNEKEIVASLLNNKIMENIKDANIYQEYEFIYQKDNNIKTGIIDLMLEYNDHIDIIDYKLKHVSDEAYIKQLNGYKDYIKIKNNKPTYIYLYSLLDKKIVSLN